MLTLWMLILTADNLAAAPPTFGQLEARAAGLLPTKEQRFQDIPWVQDLAEAQPSHGGRTGPFFSGVTAAAVGRIMGWKAVECTPTCSVRAL